MASALPVFLKSKASALLFCLQWWVEQHFFYAQGCWRIIAYHNAYTCCDTPGCPK